MLQEVRAYVCLGSSRSTSEGENKNGKGDHSPLSKVCGEYFMERGKRLFRILLKQILERDLICSRVHTDHVVNLQLLDLESKTCWKVAKQKTLSTNLITGDREQILWQFLQYRALQETNWKRNRYYRSITMAVLQNKLHKLMICED